VHFMTWWRLAWEQHYEWIFHGRGAMLGRLQECVFQSLSHTCRRQTLFHFLCAAPPPLSPPP
jgi:hypothetical protein